jgi:putative salt-induced outer membrane protein
MKIAQVLFALLIVFAAAPHCAADTVVLNNGISLTGTVDSADGKQLTLKTGYAGDVKIQWSQVKQITTDEPVFVVTPNNRTVSGTVTTEGNDLIVHTSSGEVTAPLSQTKTIRSQQQQHAYEDSLHPTFVQNWKGGGSFGLALARGNSNTTNLNIGFNADRKTRNDEIIAYASSVYARSGGPGGGVTANAILGGIRYNRDINMKIFAFGSADYAHDQLQFLDLQSIYSGGLGYHVIASANTTLDAFAGLNYTRETYSAGATATGFTTGVNRNLPGVTAGETFSRKFAGATTLTEDFTFYPQLSDLSQYRFAFDAAATTKLNRWLGWQVSVNDRYITNPPILGAKSNDIIFSTGLTVSFNTSPL